MREGASWAEASDGAALPAICWPPAEHSSAHQRSAQVAWWPRLDREARQRDRRWREGGAGRLWRRRAGEGATGRLIEGSNGILAVGQVVERLPRVARSVQACLVSKPVQHTVQACPATNRPEGPRGCADGDETAAAKDGRHWTGCAAGVKRSSLTK